MNADALPVAALIVVAIISYLLVAAFTAGEAALSRLSLAMAQDMVEAKMRNAAKVETIAHHRREARVYSRNLRSFLQTVAIACLGLVFTITSLNWWALILLIVAVCGVLLIAITGPTFYFGRRYPMSTLNLVVSLLEGNYRLWSPLGTLGRKIMPPPALTDQEARDEVADDLREMVDQIGETESIEAEDRQMIRSVLDLGRTLVREVMVPRTEMVCLELDDTLDEAMEVFVASGYSRTPVVGDSTDDIRGILFLKDVVGRMRRQDDADSTPVHLAMREARFVPETLMVDDLLRDMQTLRYHMAIVVDEYGLTAGLVTLEDLVEEVIGEVADEHDHDQMEVEEIEPGVFVVPARLGLDELSELFDLEIEDDDVDTVGGLLTKAYGRVPLVGASASTAGLVLRALKTQGRRRQVCAILARAAGEKEEKDD